MIYTNRDTGVSNGFDEKCTASINLPRRKIHNIRMNIIDISSCKLVENKCANFTVSYEINHN